MHLFHPAAICFSDNGPSSCALPGRVCPPAGVGGGGLQCVLAGVGFVWPVGDRKDGVPGVTSGAWPSGLPRAPMGENSDVSFLSCVVRFQSTCPSSCL